MNGSVYLSVCLSSCLLLIVKPWEDLKTGLLTGLQIRPHAFTCFNVKRTTDCLRSYGSRERPSIILFFYALLSRDKDLLSRYFDITKIVFS